MEPPQEQPTFRAHVFAPGWNSRIQQWALRVAYGSGLAGYLALNKIMPPAAILALWGVPLGLGVATLLRKNDWAETTIEVQEGQIRIHASKYGVRTLKARKIKALSTAVGASGIVVAIDPGEFHLKPHNPLLIRVEELSQANTIRDTLAVGNRGLGKLEWHLPSSPTIGLDTRVAWLLLLSSLSGILFLILRIEAFVLPILLAMGGLTLQTILSLTAGNRKIQLDKGGLNLGSISSWNYLAYTWIQVVKHSKQGINLTLSEPYPEVRISQEDLQGISEIEQLHLVDQIQTASQRTHSLLESKLDPEARFEALRRGQTSTSQWLQRIDAQAQQLTAYRGGEHNLSELWEALDDRDASPEIRVAAARMLLRVQPQEARLRVAKIASEQREKNAREALELAAEEQDLEELAQRLDDCNLWVDSR